MTGRERRRFIEEVAIGVTKRWLDQGRLIEAGFAAFAHFVIPKDASPQQVSDMRMAFMAGSEHTYSSMMTVFDDAEEPTDDDLRRMELIHDELAAFRGEFEDHVKSQQRDKH